MACWLEILNNNSLAAFLGAFSAFMLVVLNDIRRDRRTVQNIKNEVEMNREHAKGKREAVRSNQAALIEHNKVIPAPIMKFGSAIIRGLAPCVLHAFQADQRRALDAICYTMEATDDLLDQTLKFAEKFRGELKDVDRPVAADELLSYYDGCIVNLSRIIDMSDLYLNKEFRTVVTKQYDRDDYKI